MDNRYTGRDTGRGTGRGGRNTGRSAGRSSAGRPGEYRTVRTQKRRRRRRRQVEWGLLPLLLLVVVLGIGAVISVAVLHRKGTSSKKTAAVQAQAGNAAASGQAAAAGSSGADADEPAGDGGAADNGAGDPSLTGGEGAGADNAAVMQQAELLAAQYDYDGAISLLQGIGGGDGSSDAADAIARYEEQKAQCVAADVTRVPHIFFHSLINDDRAFKADLVGADRVRQNNAAMTTTVEFDRMMEDIYNAGYVLVGLDDLCVKTDDGSGNVKISPNTSLMLPPGKKPLVLSEDDLSYYHSYGIGTQGYATKMIVDEQGKPKCVYTNENGETSVGDYDVVPRLDTFVENHPDFSYHGAKGTVAMTGYNGVFGYRTNDYYKDVNDPHLDADQILWLQEHPDFDWEQDCRDAKAVADAMKAEGWTFASHTYGHLNAESCDLERLQHDHERWKTVNEPVLGKTDKIIFAFGADIGYLGEYTSANDKFTYFKSQGYNIFCNVDDNIGWTEFGDTFMRTGRVALDGFTMYQAMTEGAVVHSIYANDYEVLGIHDIASFFNPLRPTPINSE